MSSSLNLLIIDKDLSLYDTIKHSPLIDDFNIYFSETYSEMISFVKKNNIQVILADIDRDKGSSEQFLNKLKEFDALLDVILVGRKQDPDRVLSLINQGATDYMTRPIQMNVLLKTLNSIVEKKALRRETFLLEKRLEKKYSFCGIIGKSPYMLEIFSLIEKIAKYFTSVLITGETGTGKELVARAVHTLSDAAHKDLVVCDCVSIPENLFESELFGYMKGAFTGADRTKKGLFEEADQGIIFLDEIGEIPLPTQAKLLRVLENHEFRPLGSNETKKVTVRVIAATNRNLRDRVKDGSFREDLFHRLNKVEIHLPSLRERKEDISLLVRHYLNFYAKKFSKELKGVSREVQKLFHKYNWSGNVRELENVLERAAILTKKEFIDLADLPNYLQEAASEVEPIPFIVEEKLSTLEDLEKDYITYLLKINRNNLKKTASILKISRTTLYNKLDKYNISH